MAGHAVDAELAQVLSGLSPRLRDPLRRACLELVLPTEEIRLRLGRPVQIVFASGDSCLTPDGRPTRLTSQALCATSQDVAETLQILTESSLFAWEDELRQGFLTMPGGHRVGLAGRAVLEGHWVQTLKHFSGLAFRVAREQRGVGRCLLPWLWPAGADSFPNTLILSPPGCGKTTLLRDLIRCLSDGEVGTPVRVGLVDERCEVAASYRGQPTRDVGLRTDVLDACPKAQGMMMLIRAMSPQVLATDEIGHRDDAVALGEAINAGVSLLTTAHAASLEEAERRPVLGDLLRDGAFERVVVLSRRLGPGTLEAVYDTGVERAVFIGPCLLADLPSPVPAVCDPPAVLSLVARVRRS